MRWDWWAALLVGATGCAGTATEEEPRPRSVTRPAPAAPASSLVRAAEPSPSAVAATTATTPATTATPATTGPKPIALERADELLFTYAKDEAPAACASETERRSAIRCRLRERYGDDPAALQLALSIYDETGSVVGVERAHVMDGGWRGEIALVPERPVGRHRRHLKWMADAFVDFAGFFGDLERRAGRPAGYPWRPLEVQFFRSVGRTTPSAYATGWRIAYNVSGSLHKSASAVRETLFHEIFHLNDRAHDNWSEKALTADFDAIVARCTTKQRTLSTPCLKPFAPGDTLVRGGTFYAFQPGNGVWEYAAELAIRYYREHRRILANEPLAQPAFKCGPAPNPKMWKGLVDEFFDGIDLVPTCAPAP